MFPDVQLTFFTLSSIILLMLFLLRELILIKELDTASAIENQQDYSFDK